MKCDYYNIKWCCLLYIVQNLCLYRYYTDVFYSPRNILHIALSPDRPAAHLAAHQPVGTLDRTDLTRYSSSALGCVSPALSEASPANYAER
jgi:hypothetical protein